MNNDHFGTIFIAGMICFTIGFFLGSWAGISKTHGQALEAGVGEYDSITGSFRWKTDER